MPLSRRIFMAGAATTAAFAGLFKKVDARPADPLTDPGYLNELVGYGPLVNDPAGMIDLPEGFSYRIVSRTGEIMSDGYYVPSKHDGMACFSGLSADQVVLVRNHEVGPSSKGKGPWGPKSELAAKIDPDRLYDRMADGTPLSGGTTTLVYDLRKQALVSHHLSLAGTSTNCAGGPTPWGSWLTCEETTQKAGTGVGKDHGYVFEVPSGYNGLVRPVPLKAMGRFKHEAACIDPASGAVYLTEDMSDGVFYRFLPNDKRYLHQGGRLQALKITERPKAITSNAGEKVWAQGQSFAVDWVDLDGPESPDDSLRLQAFEKGAAQFARGEGIFFGRGELYFTLTEGGSQGFGQIARYVPSPHEGQSGERDEPGRLELFLESSNERAYDYGDNLTIAPWGHLFVCEDRYSDVLLNHLRIVTPDGKVVTFARNRHADNSEWAGVCFSPDGSTLFANLQTPGFTVAITGPWGRFNHRLSETA